MKTRPLSLAVLLVVAAAPCAFAQQNPAPAPVAPVAIAPPSGPRLEPPPRAFAVRFTVQGPGAEGAAPMLAQECTVAANRLSDFRWNNSGAAQSELRINVVATTDAERVLVELEYNERDSHGDSVHFRYSLLAQLGVLTTLRSAWDNGRQRVLQLVVR